MSTLGSSHSLCLSRKTTWIGGVCTHLHQHQPVTTPLQPLRRILKVIASITVRRPLPGHQCPTLYSSLLALPTSHKLLIVHRLLHRPYREKILSLSTRQHCHLATDRRTQCEHSRLRLREHLIRLMDRWVNRCPLLRRV